MKPWYYVVLLAVVSWFITEINLSTWMVFLVRN